MKDYFKLIESVSDDLQKLTIEQYHEFEQYNESRKISEVTITATGSESTQKENYAEMEKITRLLTDLIQGNVRYQMELAELQFLIDKQIRESKTGLEVKALKQVKENFNEYLLGHRKEG